MKKEHLFILFFTLFALMNSYAQGFGSFASAVYLEVNNNPAAFYNCSGHDTENAIGTLKFEGGLGNFTQNSNKLMLRGGEIKTWKNSGANVCTPIMYYRVYTQGNPSGSFSPVNLDWFCNCDSGEFQC